MGVVMKVLGGVADLAGSGIALGEQVKADAFNAGELRKEARAAELNAVDALSQGEAAAGRMRSDASALIARQRVLFSNSGVDATVGTPVQVAAGSRMYSELDAEVTRNNARRKAFGYKETSRKAEAQIQRIAETSEARGAAWMANSFGTILGSFGGAM